MTNPGSFTAGSLVLCLLSLQAVAATSVELPSAERPVLGSEDAPVVIVQFADYQCGYCRLFAQEQLPELQRLYIDAGRLRLEVRDFPLRRHPRSVPAARAGACADRQGKYWPMHELLYAPVEALSDSDFIRYAAELGLDMDLFERCLQDPAIDERLLEDVAAARQALVSGTPAFVVGLERGGRITGTLLVGYQPIGVLGAQIKAYAERARALAERERRPDDALQ
jgi:protein-disulfide isomerase